MFTYIIHTYATHLESLVQPSLIELHWHHGSWWQPQNKKNMDFPKDMINWYGGVLSHRATQNYHPFIDGIFKKPSSYGGSMTMESLKCWSSKVAKKESTIFFRYKPPFGIWLTARVQNGGLTPQLPQGFKQLLYSEWLKLWPTPLIWCGPLLSDPNVLGWQRLVQEAFRFCRWKPWLP